MIFSWRSPVRTFGKPRGTVLPSRLWSPRMKTWASLKPFVPRALRARRPEPRPPGRTLSARLVPQSVQFRHAAPQVASAPRGRAAWFAPPAGGQNGPRGESNSAYSSASGSRAGFFGSSGWNHVVAQFGFHLVAFGLGQRPVVDAKFRDVAVEPRAAAGPRPADLQRGDLRVGRDAVDPSRRRPRPVAAQRRSARSPGDADGLEPLRIVAGVDQVARLAVVAENRVERSSSGSSIRPSPCWPASASSHPTRRSPARPSPRADTRRTACPPGGTVRGASSTDLPSNRRTGLVWSPIFAVVLMRSGLQSAARRRRRTRAVRPERDRSAALGRESRIVRAESARIAERARALFLRRLSAWASSRFACSSERLLESSCRLRNSARSTCPRRASRSAAG